MIVVGLESGHRQKRAVVPSRLKEPAASRWPLGSIQRYNGSKHATGVMPAPQVLAPSPWACLPCCTGFCRSAAAQPWMPLAAPRQPLIPAIAFSAPTETAINPSTYHNQFLRNQQAHQTVMPLFGLQEKADANQLPDGTARTLNLGLLLSSLGHLAVLGPMANEGTGGK